MLHILLLILKIIGIILAIILGILIVLFFVIVFVPVRYEISAKCDGDLESLKAKVKATWLLHLLRADVFLKGKKLKWIARFAWVKKTNAVTNSVPERNGKNEPSNHETQKVEKEVAEDDKSEKTTEYIEEKPETKHEEYQEDNCPDEKESVKPKNKTKKIEELLEKKDKIMDLITDESHIDAFKKLKKAIFILLKRLKPVKVDGKIRFGFEDPSTTGKVLGGISMFYPVFGDSLVIIPDFEKQILKGTIYLKGKIRICHFVSFLTRLILCKNVRTTYKDIRNFKL